MVFLKNGLAEALLKEWMANAQRWEKIAIQARAAGLDVWNPPLYTEEIYRRFLQRYPPKPSPILLLGLNPGPHGMAQTGIPFTDCRTASQLLDISLPIPGKAPTDLARRLKKPTGRWRSTYERSSLGIYRFLRLGWNNSLEDAFARVYFANPCPLLFLTAEGKNVTPADPILKRLPEIADLRREAVRRSGALLAPSSVVCLGSDAFSVMGKAASELVGPENVHAYPHPARAIPIAWAAGLWELAQPYARVALNA